MTRPSCFESVPALIIVRDAAAIVIKITHRLMAPLPVTGEKEGGEHKEDRHKENQIPEAGPTADLDGRILLRDTAAAARIGTTVRPLSCRSGSSPRRNSSIVHQLPSASPEMQDAAPEQVAHFLVG
jgi:hypothetical protein